MLDEGGLLLAASPPSPGLRAAPVAWVDGGGGEVRADLVAVVRVTGARAGRREGGRSAGGSLLALLRFPRTTGSGEPAGGVVGRGGTRAGLARSEPVKGAGTLGPGGDLLAGAAAAAPLAGGRDAPAVLSVALLVMTVP